MYEIFEHTADVGIRVRANQLDLLFEEAARAMFSTITPNIEGVQPVKEVEFRLTSEAIDYLLLDWLKELLFVFEMQRLAFSQFKVRISGTTLEATAIGEIFDRERHGEGSEVKAVTYHELTVRPDGDGWFAEFILDI